MMVLKSRMSSQLMVSGIQIETAQVFLEMSSHIQAQTTINQPQSVLSANSIKSH